MLDTIGNFTTTLLVGPAMSADEYLKRAAEAEERAKRCVDGSVQQREFRLLAEKWRRLAAAAAPAAPCGTPKP